MLSKSFPFRTSFFLLFVLCVLSGDIFSQWDTYPTYDEYISMMSKFETDYPELCRIVDIGESAGGKKLLCAKITDSITTNEAEPEFFYGATLNGNEPVGFVLLLRLIDYLCTNYGTDTLVTRLVDSVEIWINPLGNPDDLYITHPVYLGRCQIFHYFSTPLLSVNKTPTLMFGTQCRFIGITDCKSQGLTISKEKRQREKNVELCICI